MKHKIKQILIFVFLVLLHASINYFNFSFVSSLGYAEKTGFLFHSLSIIGYIFWLPLLPFSINHQLGGLMESYYLESIILNSALAITLIYLFFKLARKMRNKRNLINQSS